MSRRRKGRAPTEEEHALWEQVAATLHRKAGRASASLPSQKPTPVNTVAPEAPRADYPNGVSLRPLGRVAPPVSFPGSPAKPASGLDRATEARLRKGKRAPDARIDLHGMTAMAAHAALNAFIARSYAQGLRCVLVITGKGGLHDGAPGVLRREAPHWLSIPPLADMIVHVSAAHPRHGGGGAFYVYLRKNRQG